MTGLITSSFNNKLGCFKNKNPNICVEYGSFLASQTHSISISSREGLKLNLKLDRQLNNSKTTKFPSNNGSCRMQKRLKYFFPKLNLDFFRF